MCVCVHSNVRVYQAGHILTSLVSRGGVDVHDAASQHGRLEPENTSPLLKASLLGGVRGGVEDTALAGAAVEGSGVGQQDVSGHAPRCTPRVLHLPVAGTVGGTVADSEHTVVQGGSARAGQHTGGIELEAGLVGLNGNRHGLLGDGGAESIGVLLGHIVVAGDGGGGGARRGLARTVSSLVRVCLLSAQTTVVDDVLEGVVHQATVAALVAVAAGAVHQLLLGERHQLAGLDLGDTLDRAGGGESPAGSALTLVLDGGHGALGHPVDGGGEVGRLDTQQRGVNRVDALAGSTPSTDVSGGELLAGKVGEAVHSLGPRVAGVVLQSKKDEGFVPTPPRQLEESIRNSRGHQSRGRWSRRCPCCK